MAKQDESFPTQAQLEKIVDEHFKKFQAGNKSRGITLSDVSNNTLVGYIKDLVNITVTKYYQDQIIIQQNRNILEKLERSSEEKQAEEYMTGKKY